MAGCPPLDALLVPGGKGTRELVHDAAVLDFVRTQAAGAQAVMSVCTGAFVLQAAGLLAGRSATTYWSMLPALRELGVQVLEQRFVHDGPVWTSAGVSAGTDMMLAYIAHVAGDDTAGKVQLGCRVLPRRHALRPPGRGPARARLCPRRLKLRFATLAAAQAPVVTAPDGARVQVLLSLQGGSMATFTLQPGQVSAAVTHRSVEELWYVIAGRGRMWRRDAVHEEIVALEPGLCLSVPLGTAFQFRCEGDAPLVAVAVTMPPWPGEGEAVEVEGAWDAAGS